MWFRLEFRFYSTRNWSQLMIPTLRKYCSVYLVPLCVTMVILPSCYPPLQSRKAHTAIFINCHFYLPHLFLLLSSQTPPTSHPPHFPLPTLLTSSTASPPIPSPPTPSLHFFPSSSRPQPPIPAPHPTSPHSTQPHNRHHQNPPHLPAP